LLLALLASLALVTVDAARATSAALGRVKMTKKVTCAGDFDVSQKKTIGAGRSETITSPLCPTGAYTRLTHVDVASIDGKQKFTVWSSLFGTMTKDATCYSNPHTTYSSVGSGKQITLSIDCLETKKKCNFKVGYEFECFTTSTASKAGGVVEALAAEPKILQVPTTGFPVCGGNFDVSKKQAIPAGRTTTVISPECPAGASTRLDNVAVASLDSRQKITVLSSLFNTMAEMLACYFNTTTQMRTTLAAPGQRITLSFQCRDSSDCQVMLGYGFSCVDPNGTAVPALSSLLELPSPASVRLQNLKARALAKDDAAAMVELGWDASTPSFRACNLGDSSCTSFQAYGFCCPAGSSLMASHNGPKNLYTGKCRGTGKCAKKPKKKYSPPRWPACLAGTISCSKTESMNTLGSYCCPDNTDMDYKSYTEEGGFVGLVTCIGAKFTCGIVAESDDE
jgi:hypothetical protein